MYLWLSTLNALLFKTCLLCFLDLCCFQASRSPLSLQPRGTSLCRPLTSPVPWKCKSHLAPWPRPWGTKPGHPGAGTQTHLERCSAWAPRGDSTGRFSLCNISWFCSSACSPALEAVCVVCSGAIQNQVVLVVLPISGTEKGAGSSASRAGTAGWVPPGWGQSAPHTQLPAVGSLAQGRRLTSFPSIASSELQAASSGCGRRFREAAAPCPSTACFLSSRLMQSWPLVASGLSPSQCHRQRSAQINAFQLQGLLPFDSPVPSLLQVLLPQPPGHCCPCSQVIPAHNHTVLRCFKQTGTVHSYSNPTACFWVSSWPQKGVQHVHQPHFSAHPTKPVLLGDSLSWPRRKQDFPLLVICVWPKACSSTRSTCNSLNRTWARMEGVSQS